MATFKGNIPNLDDYSLEGRVRDIDDRVFNIYVKNRDEDNSNYIYIKLSLSGGRAKKANFWLTYSLFMSDFAKNSDFKKADGRLLNGLNNFVDHYIKKNNITSELRELKYVPVEEVRKILTSDSAAFEELVKRLSAEAKERLIERAGKSRS